MPTKDEMFAAIEAAQVALTRAQSSAENVSGPYVAPLERNLRDAQAALAELGESDE